MFLSVQGTVIKESEFFINPFSDALMYGAGIFETLRFDDGIIHFAEEHLSRLRTSSQKLGMNVPYSDDRIVAYLQDLIGKQKIVSGVAKINLMCEREAALLIITTRENHYTEAQYQKGFRIKLSEYKRNEYSKLVGIKSDNYYENILEFRSAKREGWDEVLFLNTENRLAECSMSNLFFVRSGVLYTPSDDCGILNGILRTKVLALATEIGMPVRIGQYAMENLMEAEEAFLTNSVMEIMPVAGVNEKIFGQIPGTITAELREQFDKFVNR